VVHGDAIILQALSLTFYIVLLLKVLQETSSFTQSASQHLREEKLPLL